MRFKSSADQLSWVVDSVECKGLEDRVKGQGYNYLSLHIFVGWLVWFIL